MPISILLSLLGCSADVPENVEMPASVPATRALAPSAGHPPPLPPTERWVHQDSEMDNKRRRKLWFKQRHRAPEGTDWKAIEKANGLAQIQKRNGLARQRPIADEFTGKWIERGSENQAGRMHVAARSSDGTALYAGSSNGGVWRGSLQGDNWQPLGDNLAGGAHSLLLFPANSAGNPNIMLATTDNGAVHRSVDDGVTWDVPTGASGLWEVQRLIKLSDGSHHAFMVVREANQDRYRLLRSTDSGDTWQRVLDLGNYEGDVWTARTGDTSLYALSSGNQVQHSADGGDTWTDLGAVPTDGDRGELVGSEAGAPRLYAAVTSGGSQALYQSQDAGQSWQFTVDLEDYWGELNASIIDANIVAWGGVELHASTDGGANFNVVNGWGEYYDDPVNNLHADLMGIDVVPNGPNEETWYINTDGGLYESTNSLQSVLNLSLRGLRVSQYYGTLTDVTNPENVAAGAQDQGYQLTNGIAQSGERYDFDQVLSGDYAHLTSSDGSHRWLFSVYPGFMLVQSGDDAPQLDYVDFPADSAYAWLPPIVADPDKRENVFFGGTKLWRYKRNEADEYWDILQWSEQDFGGQYYEYISGLAFSPIDPQHAWVITSYGAIYRSTDKGRTWTASQDVGPGGAWLYGTAILPMSDDIDTLWIGGSGYQTPPVWRSKDGGETWKDVSEGLPPTLVYALCEAPDGSGTLFAGTETAVYRRRSGNGEIWEDITGADAPVTVYWSCEALQHENTIRFGTYGRGIWDYQLDPEGLGCFPVVDRDGDSFDCSVDCDDNSTRIFPGAPDFPCDGVDNNCDPTDDQDEAQCEQARLAQEKKCGCSQRGGSSQVLWAFLPLVLLRRRR